MLNLALVLMLVNVFRSQPLVESHDLDARAQHRAEYMCAHNQWSHDGWIQSFKGISYKYAGENLAKGFNGNTYVTVSAWINSPSHKENIVNIHYHHTGLGQACGITVQLFTD